MARELTVVCAVAATVVSVALIAQARRPFVTGDLLSAARVGDPDLSPDGRRVLFVKTTTETATGKRNADIWSVAADGASTPALFIGGDKTENTPRFLPDGKRVVFISTRDGAPQVYLSDAAGHGISQVTKISAGVQPPLVVSPDSTKIAFVSDVYPSCTTEDCNRTTRETADRDPVKVRTLTSLPYRHWDEWRLGVRHHVFVTDIASGDTRDVTPGDFDSPPHFYEDGGLTFSSDSRTVAFVSNREGRDREMWTTNQDVWLVPVAGGEAKKVTTNPAADVQPTFSPDGKILAMRSQRRAGFESDRWYLDLHDQTSGTKRTLFEGTDLSVEDFRFSRDGQSIWFTAEEAGRHNLYSISLSGTTPKRVLQGGMISTPLPGQDFVVVSKSTMIAPPEIFRVSADGSAKPLTSENAGWLAELEMPAVETASTPGAGGTPIQYFLLKPPQFDSSKKYPVVFLIHGGPQGSWADGWSSRWNPALWASQGWVVAAPNPRGSTGFGQRFLDEISQDWCGKVMTDIDGVFKAVETLPFVDRARMGIAGASYGGYAVDWIIGHDHRFKAAISHDGVFNLESMALATEELWFVEWEFGGPPWSATARRNYARCSPHLSADKIKTPTLIITNEQDFRVPVDQGLQLFTALRRNGVPSEALVFPDEGHWVLSSLNSQRWHDSVFGWMKRYIGR